MIELLTILCKSCLKSGYIDKQDHSSVRFSRTDGQRLPEHELDLAAVARFATLTWAAGQT